MIVEHGEATTASARADESAAVSSGSPGHEPTIHMEVSDRGRRAGQRRPRAAPLTRRILRQARGELTGSRHAVAVRLHRCNRYAPVKRKSHQGTRGSSKLRRTAGPAGSPVGTIVSTAPAGRHGPSNSDPNGEATPPTVAAPPGPETDRWQHVDPFPGRRSHIDARRCPLDRCHHDRRDWPRRAGPTGRCRAFDDRLLEPTARRRYRHDSRQSGDDHPEVPAGSSVMLLGTWATPAWA